MENFLGALAIIIIPAPFYFIGVNKLFKWWNNRRKTKREEDAFKNIVK